MGKLYRIDRKPGTITIEVLEKGEIINGRYVPAGNIKVVSGMVNEVYWFTPEVLRRGYEVTEEIEIEIQRASE